MKKYNKSPKTKQQIFSLVPSSEFQSIFQSTPGLYLILSPDYPKFTIVAVNDAYTSATITKPKEIIGKGLFEVFPDNPDDPTATGVKNLTASLLKVLKLKKPNKMAIQKYDIPKGKTFEVRYWSPLNAPVLNNRGHVKFIVHSVIDVTSTVLAEERTIAAEQRADEQALLNIELSNAQKIIKESEESLKRFKFMADNATDAFILARKDGSFAYLNDLALKRWGYSREEAMSIRVPDVNPVYDDLKYKNLFKKAQNEKIPTFETLHKRKDGLIYPVEVSVGGITLDGKPHLFAVARDITERKLLEKQKDDFIGIASHELKTPVTSIKAYTQVLQNRLTKEGNTQVAEHLKKMDRQLDKLTDLIGDLLDSTQAEAKKLQFYEENFDFKKLVVEIVDEIQRTTQKHRIIKKLAETQIVFGDRDRIGQVITNLLTNAIKYSPHSDKIIVKSFVDKKDITLSVQDFGIGVSKEKQQKVFERFYRVEEREHQETYAGLGLGLYISAEIIKRQGGKIWIESDIGKGTVISFCLPLKKAAKKLVN